MQAEVSARSGRPAGLSGLTGRDVLAHARHSKQFTNDSLTVCVVSNGPMSSTDASGSIPQGDFSGSS
jgi:hypothetical protein